MSQNDQAHFKNLEKSWKDFESVSDHFGTICIKRFKGKLLLYAFFL